MTKHVVIIGLGLLLMSPAVPALAVDLQNGAQSPAQQQEIKEKRKVDACDCCQKCRAAKSIVKSKEDTERAAKSGCSDCCARCGKKLKPSTEETPPEIIDKDHKKQAGTVSREPQLEDKTKINSCDCCRKCQAAKGSIKSEEEEGAAEANGCEDCCSRCGMPLESAPETSPPEIIEKQGPPDIVDKQKK